MPITAAEQANGSYIMLKARKTGLDVIKLFSCSTQLGMKFIRLTNVKRPTTFISRKIQHLKK